MLQIKAPPKEIGRTQAFLSYDTLEDVNAIDPERQFEYHSTDRKYIPSAEFHNRALMLGIPKETAGVICKELQAKGYIGLVEIEVVNPKSGVNQLQGRPVVLAKLRG